MIHPEQHFYDALDTATKYPSIETYHVLGEGGVLQERILHSFTGPTLVTEKVDGANGRIAFLPDGSYAIGSRDELLYVRGDRRWNRKLGMVEALQPVAERGLTHAAYLADEDDAIVTCYIEVYGGVNITKASRDYASEGSVGLRLFDVSVIAAEQHREVLTWDLEQIAGWRDRGGRHFRGEADLHTAAAALEADLAPRLAVIDSSELPTTIAATHAWLEEVIPASKVTLDLGARGNAEGVVLRSTDRSSIAKVRHQNYRRTAQVLAGAR